MRLLSPTLVILATLIGPSAALAQNATGAGRTPSPSMPIPGNAAAGNYWYWIAAIAVIVALVWGVPRFLRLIRSSPPRRKP